MRSRLKHRASQKRADEARLAATTLVNLTADSRATETALERGAVERVMELLHGANCSVEQRKLLIMLLANLTVSPVGAGQLLQEGKGALEGECVACSQATRASDAQLPRRVSP